jgi:hypothetical protein
MSFGQFHKYLTVREIAPGISVTTKFLRGIKLQQIPAGSSMSKGNEKQDYRVFGFIFNQ